MKLQTKYEQVSLVTINISPNGDQTHVELENEGVHRYRDEDPRFFSEGLEADLPYPMLHNKLYIE